MAKKRYPIQRRIPVRQTTANANGIVEVGKELSKANKRLYRQGRYYTVKIDLDQASLSSSPIEVYALRDTWGHQKAYQMAFDVYQKTTAEERSRLSKDQIARWLDFRVQHGITVAGAQNMLAQVTDGAGATSALTGGEFLDTQVEDKAGNTMVFTWGADAPGVRYGIMAQYEKYSEADNDPDASVSSGPYDQQDTDTSDVETLALTGRGNSPPYEANSFSERWHKVATLRALPGEQRLSTGYFTAPCGFVWISGLNGSTSTPVFMEVKAGDYKGVLADSMLEA